MEFDVERRLMSICLRFSINCPSLYVLSVPLPNSLFSQLSVFKIHTMLLRCHYFFIMLGSHLSDQSTIESAQLSLEKFSN